MIPFFSNGQGAVLWTSFVFGKGVPPIIFLLIHVIKSSVPYLEMLRGCSHLSQLPHITELNVNPSIFVLQPIRQSPSIYNTQPRHARVLHHSQLHRHSAPKPRLQKGRNRYRGYTQSLTYRNRRARSGKSRNRLLDTIQLLHFPSTDRRQTSEYCISHAPSAGSADLQCLRRGVSSVEEQECGEV